MRDTIKGDYYVPRGVKVSQHTTKKCAGCVSLVSLTLPFLQTILLPIFYQSQAQNFLSCAFFENAASDAVALLSDAGKSVVLSQR